MLKLTCIIGSPHSNGSRAYLVNNLIKGIKNPAVTIKKHCAGEI